MANLLSYTLTLKDFFTAPLRKAGAVGESAMARVARATQRVQGAAGAMGSSVSAANAKIVSSTTRATSSLTALEIKLNTLRQERSVTLNLRDLARANRAIEEVEQKMNRLENHGRRSGGNGGMGLIGGLVLGAGVAGVMGGLQETAKMQGMQNSIAFSAGGGQQGAQANQFVDKTTEKLGLDAIAATDGYRVLSGAMMGTKLQGAATQKIFEQVATATTVMGVDAEGQKGAFLALGQMMSKGKVSAEELNGQLGERIPGAMGIAAKAMGMPAAALMDLMKEGKVLSEDFLPKFAAELQNRFAPGLKTAMGGIQTKLNAFNNQWLKTKTTLITVALPAITSIMGALSGLMNLVQRSVGFVERHSTAFKVLGTVIVPLIAGIMAYTAYVKIAAVVTELWTAAQMMLNGAMMLNPVGLVVAAVMALVAAVVWAYNKFDWFRGGIWAFWESIKFVFSNISTLAKAVFEHVATIANPANWFKEGVIAAANEKMGRQLVGLAKGWGNAVRKGYKDGVGNGGISTPDALLGKTSGAPMGTPGGADVGLSGSKGKGAKGSGATGGHGVTHITINVQQLGQTTIHTSNAREGIDEMKTGVRQALLSVLNDANAMTTAS